MSCVVNKFTSMPYVVRRVAVYTLPYIRHTIMSSAYDVRRTLYVVHGIKYGAQFTSTTDNLRLRRTIYDVHRMRKDLCLRRYAYHVYCTHYVHRIIHDMRNAACSDVHHVCCTHCVHRIIHDIRHAACSDVHHI